MTKLFETANQYIKHCDWKDLAFIKICLFSMGSMLGLSISSKDKKKFLLPAILLFIATYVPAMTKFLCFLFKKTSSTK